MIDGTPVVLTDDEIELLAVARVYAKYLHDGAEVSLVAAAAERLIEAAKKLASPTTETKL